MATKRAQSKAQERSRKETNVQRFTVTFEANELLMQRLMALLLFADRLREEDRWETVEEQAPMPFDGEPVVTVKHNPEAERRAVVAALEAFLAKHGHERTAQVMRPFGKLSQVPDEALPEVLRALT